MAECDGYIYTLVLPDSTYQDFVAHPAVKQYSDLWKNMDTRMFVDGVIFINGRWIVTETAAKYLNEKKEKTN